MDLHAPSRAVFNFTTWRPPRYEEQRCPFGHCSGVIGSNVTDILAWKRPLTSASPLPSFGWRGVYAMRALPDLCFGLVLDF